MKFIDDDKRTFHYPKLTCTYSIKISNNYFSIDFEGRRKRPPSEIQDRRKSGGVTVQGG